MKAKAISVKQYLELLKVSKTSRSRNYALVNQDVRDGTVYFHTGEQLIALRDLLQASETGIPPYSEWVSLKISEKAWEEVTGGIGVEDVLNAVESLRDRDSGGFYHGRCPSCKEKGRDSDHNHFAFNPDERVIHCFSSCSRNAIMAAVRGNMK